MEFTPMWKFTQNISYWTCGLVLHGALWGTQASIFLFWMVGKSQCSTTGTSTTIGFPHFAEELPSLAMPPMLPRNIPMCGSCAWTHTVQRVQIRPNTFPQRFLSHISGTMPVSAAGHWKPRLHHSSSFSDSNSFQNIARVHPPRDSDLANSFLQYRWIGSSPKPCWTWAWAFHGGPSCALRSSRGRRWLYQVTKLLFHDLPWTFDTDHSIVQVRP